MALMRWDPTRELDVLQGDMNRLFDSFFQGRGTARADDGAVQRWIPAMDLTETAGEFVLRADLPGLSEEDIEIEVTDNVLKISGERQAERHDKAEGFYRVERAFGRFSRPWICRPASTPARSAPPSTRACWRFESPSPSRAGRARSRSQAARKEQSRRAQRSSDPQPRSATRGPRFLCLATKVRIRCEPSGRETASEHSPG